MTAEHLAAHQVDVVVGPTRVFGGHEVSTEERRLGGVTAGDLERPHLGGDVEPVPGLDLQRRGAVTTGLVDAAHREVVELIDAGRTSRFGRDHDPTAVVGAAGHAGTELGGAVAGEHEMGVGIDEPGQHTRPVGVDSQVGARPGATDGDHDTVFDHHRSVSYQPEWSVTQLGIVGDQRTDPVDHERAHVFAFPTTSAIAADSSAATSIRECSPCSTTATPSIITCGDVRRGGAEHDRLVNGIGQTAGSARRVERDRHQIGSLADGDRSDIVPTERCVARCHRCGQLPGAEHAPPAADQPLVEVDRARLLERVDDGVRVAADRQRGAGIGKPPSRPDPVSEVAFGRRAEADRRAGSTEQPDVAIGQMGRVDRREVGGERLPSGPAARPACTRGPPDTDRSRPAAR